MNTNDNELSRDTIDDDPQDLENHDYGIELDKVEIPKKPEKPRSIKVPEEPSPAEPEIESVLSPPKKKIPIIFIAVPVCLILSIIGFFMIKTMMSFLNNDEKQHSKLGTYELVEPIVTNLGDDRYIEISLMIRSTPGTNEQNFILQSQAKHHIIMLVSSAEIQMRLADGVSEEQVEAYIHDEIKSLLKKNYHNQIILKELMVR